MKKKVVSTIALVSCFLSPQVAMAQNLDRTTQSETVSSQEVSSDKMKKAISDSLGEYSSDAVLSVSGVKGSLNKQKGTVGEWKGDILSPLTNSISLSVVAANSFEEPDKMIVVPKDQKTKEAVGSPVNISDAVKKAVAGENPPAVSLGSATKKEGIAQASKKLGADVSHMTPTSLSSALGNIYSASNSTEDNKKNIITPIMSQGVIKGLRAGDQPKNDKVDIALKASNLNNGKDTTANAIFDDKKASEYLVSVDKKNADQAEKSVRDKHKIGDAQPSAKVQQEIDKARKQAPKAPRTHTLISGYVFTKDDAVAVSLVAPTAHAQEITDRMVKTFSQQFTG